MMKQKKLLRRGWFSDTVSYFYLTILAVVAAFPFLWILLCSVKGRGEILGNPTSLIPTTFTLENYKNVLVNLGFLNNIREQRHHRAVLHADLFGGLRLGGLWHCSAFSPALERP